MHLLSCIYFVFGKGASVSSSPPYLSKLDAGSGCLTASVKLWWGCLILGSMHLKVFIYLFSKKKKKGRGDELNGGIWFSGSSWRVQTSGVLKMDGELRTGIWCPLIFQSYIPEGRFCLMNDLYWREEVKRSMSLLSFAGVGTYRSGFCLHFGAIEDFSTSSWVLCQSRIGVQLWDIGNILQVMVRSLFWWLKALWLLT